MKPYPAYKPTGLKWLPEVPRGWDVLRCKNIFNVVNQRSAEGKEKLLSVSEHYGVIERSKADVTMFMAESYEGYKLCWPDDLVINSLWAWSYGMGFSHDHGIISTAYSVYRLKDKSRTIPAYYNYLIRGTDYHWEMRVRSKGLWKSRYQLSDDDFMSAPILIPPTDEQKAIVTYLDAKTAKIDRLIKLKEREIELLQEKKQVVISTVVTRGLDPNAKLVDSGVAWLGKAPQGWKIVPFKTLFRFGKGLMITKDDLTETGESVISYGQIHSKTNSGIHLDPSLLRHVPATLTVENSRLNRGDIVFADTSEDIPGCGNCVLIDTDEKVYAGYHTLIARATEKESSPYLAALFQSVPWRCQIWKKVNGVKVFSVTQKVFSGVTICIPPLEEQRKIVANLGAELMKIDRAVGAMRRQIELLREYRTRLISDAVTGRIDLRKEAC